MRPNEDERKRSEKLLASLTDLTDETFYTQDGRLIEPAPHLQEKKKKTKLIRYLTGLAAAFVFFFAATRLVLPLMRGGSGRQSGSGPAMEDGSSVFMSYKGPVLPLMIGLKEEGEDLVADRKMTFDFYLLEDKKDEEKDHLRSLLMKDHYSIENKGGQRRIQLVYPFVSRIDQLFFTAPRIMKDGADLDYRLFYSDYTGGFSPAYGGEDDREGESLNLMELRHWQDLQSLLSTSAYFEKVQDKGPDLSQVLAIVYEFKESYYPQDQEDLPNPTLVVGLDIDETETKILNMGFNGFYQAGDGKAYYEYFIPKGDGAFPVDDRHYLILVGPDTRSLTLKGQATGGFDEELDGSNGGLEGFGAQVERMEMPLDQALDLALAKLYKSYQGFTEETASGYGDHQPDTWSPRDKMTIPYEDFKALYIRDLFDFGLLGEDLKARYEWGNLEVLDTTHVPRVLFAVFEVDFEAGESVDLILETYKEGSMDFLPQGDHKGDFDHQNMLYGYDLLQGLAQTLKPETSQAEIVDHGGVKIIRQNFGFDLEEGIKSVTLSEDIPHYYMEVKEK